MKKILNCLAVLSMVLAASSASAWEAPSTDVDTGSGWLAAEAATGDRG